MKRVVITGMGTVNPAGNNIGEFKRNLYAGNCGISAIDEFDTADFPVKAWGRIKGFEPEAVFDKKELRRMDRFVQIAAASAIEALGDAGTDFKDLDTYRCGVITGVGFGGMPHTEEEHEKYIERGQRAVSPTYIPAMIPNMAAGMIAIKTGFKGANFSAATACASSTHAIGEAFRKIKDGYLDMCIAGGSEAALSKFCLSGFNNMKALTHAEDPMKASTPFDLNRSGFVLSEGGAMLVLEEYEHAAARGADIRAEIAGFGETCDAYHITLPDPDGGAVRAAAELAIREAGISLDDVDYINAHGTSTHFNDRTEAAAINKLFGGHARNIYVNSTKSLTGHMLGGTGAVEACAAVIQLSEDFVHKSLGYKTPDPECDLNIASSRIDNAGIRTALSLSLGFGGHNAALLIKKH